MNTLKLHYAKIDLDGDILFYEFPEDKDGWIEIDEVCEFINTFHPDEDFLPDDIVFLLAYKEDIYITDNFINLIACVKSFFNDFGTIHDVDFEQYYNNIYIQEYPSFQEAYTVALMMREDHKLCYSSETKDSPYWDKIRNKINDFFNN